jgi:photosystem II stability/assembly factor-like uncharacterized protein
MNANAQWASYTLPYTGIAYTLGFYDLNRGISFGHTLFPANENMFYTTNSGINWVHTNYPVELRAIADVQFINASTVYACGAENVGIRNNYNPNNDFIKFPEIIRKRFIREGKSEFYSGYKSAFIKSTDGGLNWQRGSQFDTLTGFIMDINFFDANTGYALIDSNSFGNTKFYKTTNAGVNWQFISRVDTSAEVEKMVFFNMNTGIAKGFNSGGRIYKTTNAGVNWTAKVMPSQIDCITFYNSTTGIATGIYVAYNTNVYRTTDGGSQWNVVYNVPECQFQNLQTLSSTGTAFAVGNTLDTSTSSYGKIVTIKTTNYGLNWVNKEFNPSILVYGLSIVDSDNYFMSGGDVYKSAQILKSTNGGNVFVNQTGSEIPKEYSFSQNYPNPFNSVCNVQFSMCNAGEVKIIVYDLMGREVQTLVNERLQAGMYEVRFDGSKLTSGVYFYKLITEGFSVVKKMALIK